MTCGFCRDSVLLFFKKGHKKSTPKGACHNSVFVFYFLYCMKRQNRCKIPENIENIENPEISFNNA